MPVRSSTLILLCSMALMTTSCQPSPRPKSRTASTADLHSPRSAARADRDDDTQAADEEASPADKSEDTALPDTEPAAEPAKPEVQHPSIPPLSECRWATGPIKIDGKLDEAAWQG